MSEDRVPPKIKRPLFGEAAFTEGRLTLSTLREHAWHREDVVADRLVKLYVFLTL